MIDLPGFRRAARAFRAAVHNAVAESQEVAGRHAVTHVRRFSKFKRQSAQSLKDATRYSSKPGRGSNSFRTLRIISLKKTARFLEHGTRPHRIQPRRARVLRFSVGGHTIFRRSVRHPGTKPTRFLSQATESAFDVMKAELMRRFVRISNKRI
jgi:hypothetical protein